MKRRALLKDGDEFMVLEESDFEDEAALQEALKRNPQAIPVADLELDDVVVVGRETPVPAGAIDLLLVDAQGQVIIVETKLSRNPELRRQVVERHHAIARDGLIYKNGHAVHAGNPSAAECNMTNLQVQFLTLLYPHKHLHPVS